MELPPQVRDQLVQYQQIQQQLQGVATQRFQLESKLGELDRTLEELEKVKDDAQIYKGIGSILVQVEGKESVKSELVEKKETILPVFQSGLMR